MPKATSDCAHGIGGTKITEDDPWAGEGSVRSMQVRASRRTKDLLYGQRGPSFEGKSDIDGAEGGGEGLLATGVTVTGMTCDHYVRWRGA